MSGRKSKKRLEMGEELWKERQKEKNRLKARKYLKNNPEEKKKKNRYATYWRIRKKRELIDYKGGECEKCGYSKDVLGAYDFHHIDPSKKKFGISKWNRLNIKDLIKEVDNCMLVCKNCHAEIHAEENEHIKKDAFETHEKWLNREPRLDVECLNCKKEFKQKHKLHKFCCSDCATKSFRRVERPTKDELEILINSMPMTKIGEKYGVSDNAIRKWAKLYKINYKKVNIGK